MTLKGLHGLKKFQSLAVLLGLMIVFLFAASVYTELTPLGTQPPLAVLYFIDEKIISQVKLWNGFLNW